MPPDGPAGRWQRIEALLAEALTRKPADRQAFLATACADDADIRREVASLLAAHERPGPMDRMAAELAPLVGQLRPPLQPLAGRVVGSYEILERVGGGGMGVVYKARDARLGRTVALKFLQPRLGADDSAAERFRHEARTVAALEHPNICTVHEIGETDDGQLFLAMPLYDGETLQRRITRGPLPVDEAVTIALQIARGLAKAHGRGIVHRDVKPSNVFVTDDGVVKLLDFGIAKLVDVTLTGAAGPLGTAAYMSPEQARGATVDHRTDLWSLGVVLYEMLAGVRPFPMGIAAEPADSRRAPAPLATYRDNVPAELDRIVATSLARSPDERYQSAQDVEQELLALGLTSGASGGRVSSGVSRLTRRRPVPARRMAIAVAALALLAAGLWSVTRRGGDDEPAPGIPDPAVVPATIAVLPFADRSPAQDQGYFSDGITEELIATLARVEGLRVASRTSAFAVRDRGMDIRTVGAQLGVATVLEGSVRRAGDRLRITAQLVSVADGYQLWSETYDRNADDAFAVQEEIARAIASTLRVRLVGALSDSTGRPRPNAQAYDLYLRGISERMRSSFDSSSSTTESWLRAITFFEEAIAHDSTYAAPYAAIGAQLVSLGFFDYLSPDEAFPRAEAVARKAVTLDPTFGEPYTVIAYVEMYYRWNFPRAEEEFRRALDLTPNDRTAHQWYANLLTMDERFPEAVREIRRAQDADPLSVIAVAAEGWVHYYAGDYPAALDALGRALVRNPNYALTHLWRAWTLAEMDSLPASITAHRRAVAASDSGGVFVASLARTLALAGERAEAEALLGRLALRADSGGYVPAYEIAKLHEALGRADRALDWLERARVQRSHSMVFLRVDPQLARLRGNPRFARLVRQVFPD